jgi:bifunctional non-homologous end joining protein LigD
VAVTVTHPTRVVYPETGHTKQDVVSHYERVGERLLTHVAGRALTLRRYPKGLSGGGFFQKNVPPHYPASIGRFVVPRRGGETVYPVVDALEHLVFLANQGVIEFHIPTDRVDAPFHPDRLVIDLDPPEGSPELVERAARRVGDLLLRLGLPSLPVATGSKGYHVVAPIRPTVAAHRLAEAGQKLGLLLERREPEVFTNTFRVADRAGKVFVDWMRNQPMATVVAPWSLRARPRPTVACPHTWDGLLAPDAVTLDEVGDRTDPLAAAPPVDAEPFLAALDAEAG